MSELTDAFREQLKQDKKLKKLFEKSHSSYIDADRYAIRVGEILGGMLDEEMIAEIQELLATNHEEVASFTKKVQTSLNHEANLHMQGLGVPINSDRMGGIVNYALSHEIDHVLKESIINYNQHVVTSTMKRNAEFQSEAGLQPTIRRTLHGKGCEYCKQYAGEYSYPDNVPDEVYKRHSNCRCTVDYYPGNGRKQDVWTKQYSDANQDKIAARIRRSKR